MYCVIEFTTSCNMRVSGPLLRASEGTLSRWSRLHLQSLAPTNPHWARVVGYGPFSLWVIHKEGLCPSSGDINRLMMMMMRATAPKRSTVNQTYITYIHTYIPLTLFPEGVAEASQIFIRDTHVLPKLVSYEEHCGRDRW
jgi:hypothetical protein